MRAARTLWGADHDRPRRQSEKSKLLRTHCQTSGVSLTEQDPYNNIVRTTVEALAAVLGGTQSLHTNSFDEAIALPTDFSARIARNTQLILAEESGITAVADPLGGSWYVEALTRDLEDRAWALIQEVESLGGMTKAVTEGLPKRRIEEAAAERQAKVDTGEAVIVGVNRYRLEQEDELDILEVDNAKVRAGQIERLAKLRAGRDEGRVRAALEALEAAARTQPSFAPSEVEGRSTDAGGQRASTSLRTNENLLALSVEAARARATLGEISDALERAFGRYATKPEPVSGIYGQRADLRWEEAKQGTASVTTRLGRRPRMLVAKMGQDGHDRGANLVSSAFGDLGFEIVAGPLFQTPREAAELAVEAKVDVVGASSLAAGHKTLIPELIGHLKDLGRADIKVVAGGVIPAQDYAELRAAGVQAIFGPGTNLADAADEVLRLLGHNKPPMDEAAE
jgi:methylmalonyl-CoA mutase